MSLAENVRVKGTGWTVYLRVLDGMTECDSTEEPRGRHCGQDKRGSREVTIRREESDSRGRGVVNVSATQAGSVANATERTARPLTRGRSKKPESRGR